MGLLVNGRSRLLGITALILSTVTALAPTGDGADTTATNLALGAFEARARSWEPSVAVVPEHEPARANDGSLHSYWMVRAENLPADLGVEWPEAQRFSSVVVRYFDGKMVRGPAVARTQQWARLQYWDGTEWKDLNARLIGQETSSVRYVFAPVTSTRVRVLFSEPPDPEMRRSPERLGVSVCELEVYREVPFQSVDSPDRVVRIQRHHARTYQRNYNEPPSGDADYDFAGPLVIEPKQTRVFTDTLTPTLIVAESRWVREPSSVEKLKTQQIQIRNGFLQLEVSVAGGLKETRVTNRVTGESLATPRSEAFVIRAAQKEFTPADFKVTGTDVSGNDQVGRLRVDLAGEAFDVAVNYELRRQDHFLHKWLTLSNKGGSALQVRDVVVSSLELPRPIDLMAGQELTYPVTRLEKGGFFECLETIYWEHEGDTLVYYPGVTVLPGGKFETEKAVLGVFKNRGEVWAGWDRGVREWVIEYHAQISPVRDEWPDVYCEGWSAKVGVKELLERPEWTERFMARAEKMGIRFMDGYEPMHQVVVLPPDWVKRFVDLANRYNVATGWWTDFGSDIDWGTGAPLKPLACKLSPEGEAYFRQMVELARTYKLRAMHWADFFSIFICNQTEHGHLPGKYSIYAQGQRMLKFGQELREASPGIMLGADGGFTNPYYVRSEDSRAHGTYYGGYSGDHFSAVEPDIHIDRLYADMNRAYIHGSHSIFLRPWYRMLNCVNHFGQESHLHDRAGYRYSLLSALAMAGQVTYNDVPDTIPESEIQFTRHWLGWAKANRDYLKQGDRLFDRSLHYADVWQGDADSLAGFAHIRNDRGYVFLLNPTPIEQIAELTLALDVPASDRFVVEEFFPGGVSLAGPSEGAFPQGSKLRVTVPAKQVRILWIAPASVASAKQKAQPQDARAAEWRRYVGDWTVAERTPQSATLRARFEYPASRAEYLSSLVAESAWEKEPWAYDKAYLVFLLKDETEDLHNNWVPDQLEMPGSEERGAQSQPMTALVNGVPKTLHRFKTGRNQLPDLTRCYFVDLQGETKPGQANDVEITLPIRTGLVFSGAYLDLPDQVPLGETGK